jgi:hypothetical protein
MSRFLVMMLLVVSTGAVAQGVVTQYGIRELPTSTTDQLVIGRADCGSDRVLTWIFTQRFPQPCSAMRIWATTANSCAATPATGDREFDSVPVQALSLVQQFSGSFTINIGQLPGFAAGSATPCDSAATKNVTHLICSVTQTSPNCFGAGGFPVPQQATNGSPLSIVLDVEAPNAPILSEPRSIDKGLRIAVSASSDTVGLIPFVREQGTMEFSQRSRTTLGGSKELQLEGLLNDTTYDVKVQAVDAAGNVSADSGLISGTPRRVVGFWAAYRDAGGTDMGGCHSTPGLLAPLLALLALSRRRRS